MGIAAIVVSAIVAPIMILGVVKGVQYLVKISREKNKTEIIELSNEILKVSKIKKVLAENWVVTQRNMGVVGFTLFFAVFSVIGINVLAFALALALDTGIRGQKILRTILLLSGLCNLFRLFFH